MKNNILQNVTGFILKYIWLFCALLILFELVSVSYTTGILMQQSALGMMQSVSGDVSSRVDGTLRLLTGMANDTSFADTSKPLFDRAMLALPYQKSYNLYMIALTDQDVNVISANETAPPTENYSLGYREYMQQLYKTGQYQITDAIVSADGNNTMNYTIAVPITKNGKVEGSVFGSIYFKEIEEILQHQSKNSGRDFYLFGSNNTIMAGDNGEIQGQSFLELSSDSFLLNTDVETVNQSIKNGTSGDFWEWDKEGLTYVSYQQVSPTHWTILYRVQFIPVFMELFPALCLKVCFYILICTAVYIFGRKYLNRQFSQINHLLDRMATMQKELLQSEGADYENLLDLSQQGLMDQLTGLSTRTLLFKKVLQLTTNIDFKGIVAFIDLDDLKHINDTYGHDSGDCALLHFSNVLKDYEHKYNAIVARYGGDEFILVLNIADEKEISTLMQNLCDTLHTSITNKNHTFTIHSSIGLSYYPEHGATLEELICKADLALYSAKQNGKNQYAIYNEENPNL